MATVLNFDNVLSQYTSMVVMTIISSLHSSSKNYFHLDIQYNAGEKGLQLKTGICLPASCSEEKSLNYANRYLSVADMEGFKIRCQTNDRLPFEFLDVLAM